MSTSKVRLFRCLECGHHRCVCTREEVEATLRSLEAGPAPRQFPKGNEDWFAEGRPVHRVQIEELEGIEE